MKYILIIIAFTFSIIQSCAVSSSQNQSKKEQINTSKSETEMVAKLLIEYSNKVKKLDPQVEWGNPNLLVNKMKTVSEKISAGEYEIKQFFTDFNTKNPQGEMWHFLDSQYPELKEIGSQIRKKVEKLEVE